MLLPQRTKIVAGIDLPESAASIAAAQQPDGAIPWFRGGHLDPWDHIEAAMGLDVGGLHAEAARAYRWLRSAQRPDGSWAAEYRDGRVANPMTDANFSAYVAVGSWHHFLVTGDRPFLEEMWPTVRAGIECIASLQAPDGPILWARSADGTPADEALLTSSSSIYQSIRCALAIAGEIGESEPGWELLAGHLGHAIVFHPERFTPKDRFSMDWYYPILGGALRGPEAERRIEEGWVRFWVDGLGARCVDDEPWVTGAETCELALALDCLGDRERAELAVASIQHLRTGAGSYWTGYQFIEEIYWPVEQTTWTAAAVLLAVDALRGITPASGIFRGEELPTGVAPDEIPCVEGALTCDDLLERTPGTG